MRKAITYDIFCSLHIFHDPVSDSLYVFDGQCMGYAGNTFTLKGAGGTHQGTGSHKQQAIYFSPA
jgi:hypothetical protein